jgi:hypothetical protein
MEMLKLIVMQQALFTLLWKCNKVIITQQELLRYHGNAIWCIDHVTKENLICHNINRHHCYNTDVVLDGTHLNFSYIIIIIIFLSSIRSIETCYGCYKTESFNLFKCLPKFIFNLVGILESFLGSCHPVNMLFPIFPVLTCEFCCLWHL